MWLVIGIGNTLRHDDGLGPWLAERVAEWWLPNVAIRIVHQLTPELAVDIANHERVLFLDASRTQDESGLVEVESRGGANSLGHALGPGEVMALANSLDGRARRAWVMPVPGSDFRFGEGLSPDASEAAERALADIGRLLRENVACTKADW